MRRQDDGRRVADLRTGASRPVRTIVLMEREGRYALGSRSGEENQRSRSGAWGLSQGPRETAQLLFRLPAPALQPPGRTRRQRLPSSYHARALSRLHVVCNAGKQPAQFDRGRQLALLLECGADRGGCGFGDDEHPRRMVTRAVTGKRCVRGRRVQRIAPIAVGCRRLASVWRGLGPASRAASPASPWTKRLPFGRNRVAALLHHRRPQGPLRPPRPGPGDRHA